MKLRQLEIRNFLSFDEEGVEVEIGDVTALVGQNNSGKSNIIKALDLLLRPQKAKIDKDTFHHGGLERQIEIKGVFEDLTPGETAKLKRSLDGDRLVIMRRWWRAQDEEGHPLGTDNEPEIADSVSAFVREPEAEWLVEDNVNQKSITKWRTDREALTIGEACFLDYLPPGGTPKVEDWKKAIPGFIEKNREAIPMVARQKLDPKGLASVLQHNLPEIIWVPAIREVEDEAKVQKTNPFGQLVNRMVEAISEAALADVKTNLEAVARRLNRSEPGERIEQIQALEEAIKRELNRQIPCDLEIEIETPRLDTMLTTGIRILADDGFRSLLDKKGHGLQRSVLFSLLRTYVQLDALFGEEAAPSLRPAMFAIEEPEIYLHPQLQRRMLALLYEIGQGADQVVYSTHSPLLVEMAWFDDIRVVRKEGSGREAHTHIEHLTADRLLQDLVARCPDVGGTASCDSIRERYENAYSPGRNEGFFAAKVILVEGATEAAALPVYAAAMGYDLDAEGISVVETGGIEQMDRLLRVYNELGIPCFVVADCHQGRRPSDVERLAALLGEELPQGPLGSAFVSGSLFVHADKWETTIRAEVGETEYDELSAEAGRYLGTDSKTLKARFVARRLREKGSQAGDEGKFVPQSARHIVEGALALEWRGSVLKT